MVNRYRRDAAVLAAYLAQFDTDDTGMPDASSATAIADDRASKRADYTQALSWATAPDFTADDIAALARMRIYYGFPATG
ncbi:hypothetical protein BKP42_68290 [Rhodococcus erythropolis]|uniref:hypothetical protein n=1 Tax=Rhodococcus erythropolis TaxID=1833 RepID=UPI000BB3DD2E|nr:hypothetical protein [Rhodococcus erythropolis]PBI83057.1 hypothetical protein BKP42_68290 [Rhodococcus erythropolis]